MDKEPEGDWWYGVGVGVKLGVYKKWKTAKAQVHRFSGFKVKKFKSAVLADDYVQRVRKKKVPAKWFVLRGSSRDGAYMSRAVAESYQGEHGQVRKMWSIAAAKEFVGNQRIPIYNEQTATSRKNTLVGTSNGSTKTYYAVRGGSCNGVFQTIAQELVAM